MKRRRHSRWQMPEGNSYVDPRGDAYSAAKEAMRSANAERMYLCRPWRAIFAETLLWLLRFFPLALMSFHLFIIPLVPAWIMMIYKYFYVFLNKLDRFGISKLKYGIFSAIVIAGEIVASHFIRQLLLYAYKAIFN